MTKRWWAFAHNRMIKCPAGHHIKSVARINETGFIRCNEWIHTANRECGTWVFIFAIRGRKCIIAEVTLDEQTEMEELATPAEMLDYLGLDKRMAG